MIRYNKAGDGVRPSQSDLPEDLDVALRSHTPPRATFELRPLFVCFTLTLLTESLHRANWRVP